MTWLNCRNRLKLFFCLTFAGLLMQDSGINSLEVIHGFAISDPFKIDILLLPDPIFHYSIIPTICDGMAITPE
jgi:hypothetical protein